LEDVLALKEFLTSYHTESHRVGTEIDRNSNAVALCEILCDSLCNKNFALGDLQPIFNAFQKALSDYDYFLKADYHNKKIAVIEKQIATQKNILQKSKNQLNLSQKQLASAKKIFAMDSTIFAKNVISSADFEASKTAFLQSQQSYGNAKLNIDNQQIGILQLEQSIFDLQQQRVEQDNAFGIALNNAADQLGAQIQNWEQSFLLVAPTDGIASFTKYRQKNQNINAGEVLVTIVPRERTKIIGKIYLPPQGAGKVKTGQTANVKFDNFPYMEYGMMSVKIHDISLIPTTLDGGQKVSLLEVVFPDSLTTNYGKTLTFSQEMTGSAEIITQDLRLIDRFINPIKAVIKR
jgi:HlyD family secretion protein